MKMQTAVLAMLLISILAISGAVEAETPKASESVSEVKKKADDIKSAEQAQRQYVHEQIGEIRKGLEKRDDNRSKLNEIVVKAFPYSERGMRLEVSWREGKKSLFFFNGKKYRLTLIDEDGNGELKSAEFNFVDSSDGDNTVSVNRVFRPPFPAELKTELKGIFTRLLAEARKDPGTITHKIWDEIKLDQFYERFVKQPIIDRLK